VTFILIYHDVVEAAQRDLVGFPGPLAGRYKLTPELFDAHLSALARAGVEVGLVQAGKPLPKAALSFDDGGSSAVAAAAALEQRGWRGHFFVTTSRLGTPGFLTADELGEMAARGHCIGSHSHTHPTYMGALTRRELDAEWRQSRSVLEDALGQQPTVASVPGGFLSETVVASAAAAGYEVLMTSEPRSKPGSQSGILVLGRYTIWGSTPSRIATAYACGSPLARGRLWVEWESKQLAKRVSPQIYERGRRLRARYPG
jgi:peptidoglycan/xylan/chitin deacetylase (PgdA/CDA1 family)